MSKRLYGCELPKGICDIHTGPKPSEQPSVFFFERADVIMYRFQSKPCVLFSKDRIAAILSFVTFPFDVLYCNMIKPSFIYG